MKAILDWRRDAGCRIRPPLMKVEIVMLKRFKKALSVWMCVPLVLAVAANLALAETSVRIDYGKIEAIEIHRASDNRPVNVGALVGGVAGGVIGHQIGGGRGKTAATIAGAIGGAATSTCALATVHAWRSILFIACGVGRIGRKFSPINGWTEQS